MKRVAILGGGISGLSCAYALFKKSKITLFEKSERLGGWIKTNNCQGYLFEGGPRAFRSSGKGQKTLQLIKAIGLENELIKASTCAQKRYLWHENRLQPLSLPFLLRHGIIAAYFRDRKAKLPLEEVTIGEFFQKRIGRNLTELLIDPLVTGIFGGNLHEISFQAAWPHLYEAISTHGSLVSAMRAQKEKTTLYSFMTGMERLPQRLGELLSPHIDIRLSTTPTSFDEFDHVIVTLPAHACADLFPKVPQVKYQTITTIHCGWSKQVLRSKGFGYLIPSSQKERILGCTFDSEVFEEQNQGEQTRLCFMLQGAPKNAKEIVLDALQRHLGIKEAPEVCLHTVAEKAIPQYELGHMVKIRDLCTSKITFASTFTHGIGVNDCISGSALVAEQLLERKEITGWTG